MNMSASVTIVDKLEDCEEDWRHGEEEVVVWSNGGETLQHANGEALSSSTTAVDVDHSPTGRDSHPGALLIASLANLGISYNVVRDLKICLFSKRRPNSHGNYGTHSSSTGWRVIWLFSQI